MDKLKRIFLKSFIITVITLVFLKILHLKNEATLEAVLAQVENKQLTIEYLKSALGNPDNDELQDQKAYNLSGDEDFDCKPPFRYISYDRGPLIIFELKHEDTLSFYFEQNGRFCYFERHGL